MSRWIAAATALAAFMTAPALAHHGDRKAHPVKGGEEVTAAQQMPFCASNRPRVNPNGSKAKCPLLTNPGNGPVRGEPTVQPPVVLQDQ